MIERHLGSLAVLVLVLGTTGACAHLRITETRDDDGAPDARSIVARYGQLPLIFERSADEFGRPRRFIARGANHAIEVSAQGVRFALRAPPSARVASSPAVLLLRFVGGNADAGITGADPLATRIHHFRGGSARDEVDVATYGRVVISDLYPGIEERVVSTVEIYDVVAETLVQSFDHGALARMERLNPDVRLGALVAERPLEPLIRSPGVAHALCPDAALVTEEAVAEMLESGLNCFVWTVNEPAQMDRLVGWGVSGIITDRPGLLRARLGP